MTPGPWVFRLHLFAWVTLAVGLVAYLWAVSRPRWATQPGQRVRFAGGLAVVALAVTWPLGDVAMRWSLTALVAQRLLLLLAAPPLLASGLPRTLVASLTRPWPFDRVAAAISRPLISIAVVTAVGIGTLVTPVVDTATANGVVRVVVASVLLGAGFVLWAPVLDFLPATRRMSPMGKAAYLGVQSLLPGFFSVIWIFARRPLYSTYDRPFLSFSPVGDQQFAGFTAKLATIAVMWTVAGLVVSRAGRRSQPIDQAPEALEWIDFQRSLERIDRQERRDPANAGVSTRRRARSAWLPPSAATVDDLPGISGKPDTNGTAQV